MAVTASPTLALFGDAEHAGPGQSAFAGTAALQEPLHWMVPLFFIPQIFAADWQIFP
jgi:hypothetical protein